MARLGTNASDRLSSASDDCVEFIQHRQSRGCVQLTHLAIQAPRKTQRSIACEAEVDREFEAVVQCAVACKDSSALAYGKWLGRVKGNDLRVALCAHRGAVIRDCAKASGGIYDQREAS